MSSLVFITRNSRPQLHLALTKLLHQHTWGRLIVVDNGSEDGTADMLRHLFPKVVLVQLGNEVDWAVAERAGRAFLRGEEYATVWLNEARQTVRPAQPRLVAV